MGLRCDALGFEGTPVVYLDDNASSIYAVRALILRQQRGQLMARPSLIGRLARALAVIAMPLGDTLRAFDM